MEVVVAPQKNCEMMSISFRAENEGIVEPDAPTYLRYPR